MISFTTPAYVLRYTDVGAVDRLYSVYTKERGKIDLLAKGIRKAESKLQSSMQLISELELYIIAQRRFTLGGSVIRESFPKIQTSLLALWAAQHALELIEQTTKQEHPDDSLFQLIQTFFSHLNNADTTKIERVVFMSVWFDLGLLRVLGHAPALHKKEMEQNPDAWVLLASDGIHKKSDSSRQAELTLDTTDRSLLRFAQQKSIDEVAQVALNQKQAKRQLACARVLLRSVDAVPLSTDTILKSFGGIK